MDKDKVIKLRDALKADKNLPLRILIDNGFTTIDESYHLQFTKWDDTNGILYSFRLVDMNRDRIPSNKANSIAVFAVEYESIQCMELAVLPLKDLDAVFDGISDSGCTISDAFRNLIKGTFEYVLSSDRYELSPTTLSNILGPNAVNDKDDYYAQPGKFTESFKETIRYRKHNEDITSNNS